MLETTYVTKDKFSENVKNVQTSIGKEEKYTKMSNKEKLFNIIDY